MMDGFGFMNGWGGMAFGGFMMVFWFALLIGVAVLLFRWITGSPRQNTEADAMETLRQRYARGEIDAAEFDERSRKLEAGR